MSTGQVRVGTSGWSYRAWRGDFYPAGLPHRAELGYLGERLDVVELNGSFYSLQRPTSYATWREQVPVGTELAVKGSRFLTHMKRLREPEAGLANLCASGVLALGPALGPVLWQLPADLELDVPLVEAFLALLPRTHGAVADLAARHDDRLAGARALTEVDPDVGLDRPVRHVLEARHPSWDTPAAARLLTSYDVGTVLADTAGHFPVIDADTSPVRYVRLHGHTRLYESGYSPANLDHWARRVRGWAGAGRDVYVLFDNDAHGRAPYDAVALRERLLG